MLTILVKSLWETRFTTEMMHMCLCMCVRAQPHSHLCACGHDENLAAREHATSSSLCHDTLLFPEWRVLLCFQPFPKFRRRRSHSDESHQPCVVITRHCSDYLADNRDAGKEKKIIFHSGICLKAKYGLYFNFCVF